MPDFISDELASLRSKTSRSVVGAPFLIVYFKSLNSRYPESCGLIKELVWAVSESLMMTVSGMEPIGDFYKVSNSSLFERRSALKRLIKSVSLYF